jgi:hypothetical protein
VPVGYEQWFYTPADHGYLAATGTVEGQGQSIVMSTAGALNLARIKVPQAGWCTNVTLFEVVAASAGTPGQNFAALYTAAGTLIAQSVDQTTSWGTTGTKNAQLNGGPYYLPVGEYYAGFWYNGTTGPTFTRVNNSLGTTTNSGRAAPNLLAATADTSLTTAAPAALGAQTSVGTYWLVALS